MAANVPFPHVMTYFVSSVEFVGGLMLLAGFLTSLACIALMGDMTVAILTTKLAGLPKGVSPLNSLDNFLYLPEALYVLFFYLADLFRSRQIQHRSQARSQDAIGKWCLPEST